MASFVVLFGRVSGLGANSFAVVLFTLSVTRKQCGTRGVVNRFGAQENNNNNNTIKTNDQKERKIFSDNNRGALIKRGERKKENKKQFGRVPDQLVQFRCSFGLIPNESSPFFPSVVLFHFTSPRDVHFLLLFVGNSGKLKTITPPPRTKATVCIRNGVGGLE